MSKTVSPVLATLAIGTLPAESFATVRDGTSTRAAGMLAMKDKVHPRAAQLVAGLLPTLTMPDLLQPTPDTLARIMLAAGEVGLYRSHAENPLPTVAECTAAQAAGRVTSFLPLGDGTALAIGADGYEYRAGGAHGKGCQKLPPGRTAVEHGAVITKAMRSALSQRLEAHAATLTPPAAPVVEAAPAAIVATVEETAPETSTPAPKVPKVPRKLPTKGKAKRSTEKTESDPSINRG